MVKVLVLLPASPLDTHAGRRRSAHEDHSPREYRLRISRIVCAMVHSPSSLAHAVIPQRLRYNGQDGQTC